MILFDKQRKKERIIFVVPAGVSFVVRCDVGPWGITRSGGIIVL